MCEFCTKHGEGQKWHENIRNYTEEIFHQVSSEEKLKAFLSSFISLFTSPSKKGFEIKGHISLRLQDFSSQSLKGSDFFDCMEASTVHQPS
jgi:hypothetical protein